MNLQVQQSARGRELQLVPEPGRGRFPPPLQLLGSSKEKSKSFLLGNTFLCSAYNMSIVLIRV